MLHGQTGNPGFILNDLFRFQSLDELEEAFSGAVTHEKGNSPERSTSILFENKPGKVLIQWYTDSTGLSVITEVSVVAKNSPWQTADGVRIGLTVQELQTLNGRPFAIEGYFQFFGQLLLEKGDALLDMGVRGQMAPDKGDIYRYATEDPDYKFSSDSKECKKMALRLTYLSLSNPKLN